MDARFCPELGTSYTRLRLVSGRLFNAHASLSAQAVHRLESGYWARLVTSLSNVRMKTLARIRRKGPFLRSIRARVASGTWLWQNSPAKHLQSWQASDRRFVSYVGEGRIPRLKWKQPLAKSAAKVSEQSLTTDAAMCPNGRHEAEYGRTIRRNEGLLDRRPRTLSNCSERNGSNHLGRCPNSSELVSARHGSS